MPATFNRNGVMKEINGLGLTAKFERSDKIWIESDDGIPKYIPSSIYTFECLEDLNLYLLMGTFKEKRWRKFKVKRK